MCQNLHFARSEFLKGTWSQMRINDLFKCREVPSFIWIHWDFLFFLLSVVTAWEMSYHVKQIMLSEIIWKNIKATLQLCVACSLLWGCERELEFMILIIKHSGMSIKFDLSGGISNYALMFSFLPFHPCPIENRGFQVTFLWTCTKATRWDNDMPDMEFLPPQTHSGMEYPALTPCERGLWKKLQ